MGSDGQFQVYFRSVDNFISSFYFLLKYFFTSYSVLVHNFSLVFVLVFMNYFRSF